MQSMTRAPAAMHKRVEEQHADLTPMAPTKLRAGAHNGNSGELSEGRRSTTARRVDERSTATWVFQ
ncbi:hypothetical protein JKF63_01467 [Porcisia hertigi]|uniref:Uncharacterized protein n=1 Tax=Porcisia hertigi TaxID=2761500 RepID=A0A836HUS9_9TRYP|nr:hypothetical protein JKF63_01467 [Porcisia hertigi]